MMASLTAVCLTILVATQDNIRAVWAPREGYPSYVCDSYTPLVGVITAAVDVMVMCPLIFFLYRGIHAAAATRLLFTHRVSLPQPGRRGHLNYRASTPRRFP